MSWRITPARRSMCSSISGARSDFRRLEGVHNRGDFDLSQHQQFSGKKLEYFDQPNNAATSLRGGDIGRR